jgi:hypothetical protein
MMGSLILFFGAISRGFTLSKWNDRQKSRSALGNLAQISRDNPAILDLNCECAVTHCYLSTANQVNLLT